MSSSLTDAGARAATTEMKARIGRKFRKMPAANGAVEVPQRAVLYEVSVDSVETWEERHITKMKTWHRPNYTLLDRPWLADAFDPASIARRTALTRRQRDRPGWRRRIDAVAVGLWGSVAGEIDGFEIKVTRSDLQAELRDPRKAATGIRFCTRWWLAVADISITTGLDIPPHWGILAPSGKGLRIHHQAPELEPDRISGQFLASLICSTLTQSIPNLPRRRPTLAALVDAYADEPERLAHLAALVDFPEPKLDPMYHLHLQ